MNTQTLYLDLIQSCLLNQIYEDPPMDPWSAGIYMAEKRESGRDWPSMAHTMIGEKRMSNLRMLCEQVLAGNIPGDFIETGVWRGGACIYMRAIMKAHGITDRRVWVADSFEGLPHPNSEKYQHDRGDTHHTYEQLKVSIDQVAANFRKYGLLDEQVQFLRGWFKDTLPNAPIERLAILRLDGDMYESTMDAFEALYHKVSRGGAVIIDDYGAVPACNRAVLDFRECRGITAPIIDIDGLGIYWNVP